MKILHVLPSLAKSYGGPVTNTVAASLALQQLGAQISIYSVDSGTIPQSRERRAARMEDLPEEIADLDAHLFRDLAPHRLAFSPALARALFSDVAGFDVVHVHQLFLFPQFAAWRSCIHAEVPYIVSPRGSLDPYLRAKGRLRKKITDLLWQRRMLDHASVLHLTSQPEMDLLQDLQIRAPHRVVPNGIDVSIYQKLPSGESFRRSILGTDEGILVANHGRISQKKGLDILVEAFAPLVGQIQNPHLVLIGPDDEGLGENLRQQARFLGVGDRVHLIGSLHGQDLLAAMAAIDVWALPSFSENFGNAVIEAMAAGVPVVTTPHVNIAPDAFRAGALEMVPNKVEDFTTALIKVAKNPDYRDHLSTAGARYAHVFDWSNVARQMLDMYTEVAKK